MKYKQPGTDDVVKIKELFIDLNRKYIKEIGLTSIELQNSNNTCHQPHHQSVINNNNNNTINAASTSTKLTALINPSTYYLLPILLVLSIYIACEYDLYTTCINHVLGIRCVIRNNYFVWEATRPLSDCQFCANRTHPVIVLENVTTRAAFAPYAYSSQPIVVKGAFRHWRAIDVFDFAYFKGLYDRAAPDSYASVDEECQFLHFKSNFISLKDVFAMAQARIDNAPGEKSWYVGWGNCHPQILAEMRQYYEKPHFLPDDCEIPSKEYVFMGYDDGATMHLDFINRLMWQAQLKGSKTWFLLPPPECEDICSKLSFFVEPGDAVLVDTRIWYHGTTITPGEFSLSIQSEYG